MKHRLSISRLDLLVCRLDAWIDDLNACAAQTLGGGVGDSLAKRPIERQWPDLDSLAALQKAERLARERVALQSRLSAEKELHDLNGKEQLKDTLLRQVGILQGILEAHAARTDPRAPGHPAQQLPALTPEQVQTLEADVSRLKLELVALYDALVWVKALTLQVEVSADVNPLVDEVLGKSRGSCTRYQCPQAAQCA